MNGWQIKTDNAPRVLEMRDVPEPRPAKSSCACARRRRTAANTTETFNYHITEKGDRDV